MGWTIEDTQAWLAGKGEDFGEAIVATTLGIGGAASSAGGALLDAGAAAIDTIDSAFDTAGAYTAMAAAGVGTGLLSAGSLLSHATSWGLDSGADVVDWLATTNTMMAHQDGKSSESLEKLARAMRAGSDEMTDVGKDMFDMATELKDDVGTYMSLGAHNAVGTLFGVGLTAEEFAHVMIRLADLGFQANTSMPRIFFEGISGDLGSREADVQLTTTWLTEAGDWFESMTDSERQALVDYYDFVDELHGTEATKTAQVIGTMLSLVPGGVTLVARGGRIASLTNSKVYTKAIKAAYTAQVTSAMIDVAVGGGNPFEGGTISKILSNGADALYEGDEYLREREMKEWYDITGTYHPADNRPEAIESKMEEYVTGVQMMDLATTIEEEAAALGVDPSPTREELQALFEATLIERAHAEMPESQKISVAEKEEKQKQLDEEQRQREIEADYKADTEGEFSELEQDTNQGERPGGPPRPGEPGYIPPAVVPVIPGSVGGDSSDPEWDPSNEGEDTWYPGRS
jgi:hypothetical protein